MKRERCRGVGVRESPRALRGRPVQPQERQVTPISATKREAERRWRAPASAKAKNRSERRSEVKRSARTARAERGGRGAVRTREVCSGRGASWGRGPSPNRSEAEVCERQSELKTTVAGVGVGTRTVGAATQLRAESERDATRCVGGKKGGCWWGVPWVLGLGGCCVCCGLRGVA